MRWLIMIASFIMKRIGGGERRHPIEELKEFLRENALKLFVGMALIITLGTMLTAGTYMAVAALTSQVDMGLAPRMTSMVLAGAIMALVPTIILAVAWYKSSPPQPRAPKRKHAGEVPVNLEEALALLVNDFIKEREMKREMKYEHKRRMAEAELNATYQSAQEGFERH